MREFRLSKTDKEHYNSFQEAAAAFGCRPVKKKRSSNKDKLEKDREKFLGTCRVCKNPMQYNGGNICTCSNPQCKGIVFKQRDEEENEKEWSVPVYRILDSYGTEIATNLFD